MVLRPDTVGVLTATERVATGVAALDRYGPVNWRGRVESDRLDVCSARWCPVGQLFGGFGSSAAQRFLSDACGVIFEVGYANLVNRVRHGFHCGGLAECDQADRTALNAAWRVALTTPCQLTTCSGGRL